MRRRIFAAGERGKIATYIVAPTAIYGLALNNSGNRNSQQIPGMIRQAVKRRQVVYVGKGTNIWTNVRLPTKRMISFVSRRVICCRFAQIHIDDLSDLYCFIIKHAMKLKGPPPSPYETFFFAGYNELSWGDAARLLAPLLYELGEVDSAEAVSIPLEEAEGMRWVANNSRSVSKRAHAIGWRPHRMMLYEALREDTEAVLEDMKKT